MRSLQLPSRHANSHRPSPIFSGSAAPQRIIVALKPTPFMPIVRAKLRIGDPNDAYEQEADRVVDQVMRIPEPEPAMKSTTDSLEGVDTLRPKCAFCTGGEQLCPESEDELQRQPNDNEADLQLKATAGQTPSLPPPCEANIRSLRGRCEPLTASQRDFFEPGFGMDFSAVRVHTGPDADELARSLNARAFTVGSEIVFDRSEFNPGLSAGLNLLAHELTHVAQQGYATPMRQGWTEKEEAQQAQTVAPSGRFAAFQIASLEREPTNPMEALQIRDQPDGIVSPMPQTGASIVLRQEVSEKENSTAKGGTPSPVPSDFTFYETTIHDADTLPPDLRSKLKAYFLITYEAQEFYMFTENIPGYDLSEKESIQDEMEYLKNLGYLVVYIEHATENDITNAFADPQAAMIFTTGHGDPPGIIRTTNKEFVEPEELTIPPDSNLTQVILGHCHIGDQYEKWKQVLPEDARFTAWTGKTSTRESVQFNSGGGFSDRQWGSLMSRVKSLAQLENQEGEIYRVTEKGETTVIKSWETGEVISE
ncbi:MAG TPA: DUF4157 domain-containing protein [Terrimicrobiaceae bacterium]